MAAPGTRRLPVLAAALLLCAACGRKSPEAPAETPELAAPEPSSSLIATPLDAAATGYTNEMQAAYLSRERSELGIRQISRHLEEGDDVPGRRGAPPPAEVEQDERLARLREMRLAFTRARRGIEDARDRSVALPGSTAAIIPGRKSGAPVGPAEDGPGIWSGAYGGAVEAGERVVTDAAAWAELWGRLSRESPPDVDFARTRIAAVFVGPRPASGRRARLIGIATEPARYLLRWSEEGPGPGEAAANGAAAPFLLVSVPKDGRAIRWDKIGR
ncbi:MAG: hypothetical protein HY403_00165 [Elusimicrobia bacterium]|nr:hypothetical protein [Elusimicrobiota bacterium]